MQIAIFFSGKIVNVTKEKLLALKETYNPVCFASINIEHSTPYIDEFIELMGITPDRIQFERVISPDFKSKTSSKDVNIDNVYGMFYHNKKCMDLIANYPIKFDCVIKYRSDIDNFDKLIIPSSLSGNTVYIPKGSDWCGGVNDQIAYGNPDSMLRYSSVVNNISKYLAQGINIHPETLLAWHLRMNLMNTSRFTFVYSILRTSS